MTKSIITPSQFLQLSISSSESFKIIDSWRNCNYNVGLIKCHFLKRLKTRCNSQPPIHKCFTWKIWWNAHSNINEILAISWLFFSVKKSYFAQLKSLSLNPAPMFLTNNMWRDLAIFFLTLTITIINARGKKTPFISDQYLCSVHTGVMLHTIDGMSAQNWTIGSGNPKVDYIYPSYITTTYWYLQQAILGR